MPWPTMPKIPDAMATILGPRPALDTKAKKVKDELKEEAKHLPKEERKDREKQMENDKGKSAKDNPKSEAERKKRSEGGKTGQSRRTKNVEGQDPEGHIRYVSATCLKIAGQQED